MYLLQKNSQLCIYFSKVVSIFFSAERFLNIHLAHRFHILIWLQVIFGVM